MDEWIKGCEWLNEQVPASDRIENAEELFRVLDHDNR